MVDGVGSVEQPIDGRAPFRSFRRRNDPAVGQDHGLAPRPPSRGVRRRKVRPRNGNVTRRPSGRRVKPALASTPRNAKRGDKRAHSSNPGKALFGLRTQFGPLISPTISGGCGGNMTKPRMRHRARRPTAASRRARPYPEGLPPATTAAYLCPHHACPSAYSSDRLHRAVPPHQNPHCRPAACG